MTAPITATKPKAHRSRAAKQDKPSADAQQQQPAVAGLSVAPVVLKPAIAVAPVIRTSESTLAPARATGPDRQRKRQTTTTTSPPSTKTGKWSKNSEEDTVPENPGAAGGSIFNYQVDAAEGEEKNPKMGTAFGSETRLGNSLIFPPGVIVTLAGASPGRRSSPRPSVTALAAAPAVSVATGYASVKLLQCLSIVFW